MIAHKGFLVEFGICNPTNEFLSFLPLPDILLQPILYGIFCIGISNFYDHAVAQKQIWIPNLP